MDKLSRDDLLSLETYHERRDGFRRQVMAHKAKRKLYLGPHATLYFEDRLTIQYQIQEMLRIERIFEPAAIQEELDAYNPLIPEGDNWKATFMLEYDDPDERKAALARLVGVEERVWVRVGDHERVLAVADEDLERSKENKTSAVHFLRFQLRDEMLEDARAGAAIAFGIDHEACREERDPIPETVRRALAADLVA